MLSIFRKLMNNDDGATAIEYVLIASLISVAAITAMGKVGGKVSNVLSNVANAMTRFSPLGLGRRQQGGRSGNGSPALIPAQRAHFRTAGVSGALAARSYTSSQVNGLSSRVNAGSCRRCDIASVTPHGSRNERDSSPIACAKGIFH